MSTINPCGISSPASKVPEQSYANKDNNIINEDRLFLNDLVKWTSSYQLNQSTTPAQVAAIQPKSAPAQQAAAKQDNIFTVKQGDTLWNTVKEYRKQHPEEKKRLSLEDQVKEVAKSNNINLTGDPGHYYALIKPGDKITFGGTAKPVEAAKLEQSTTQDKEVTNYLKLLDLNNPINPMAATNATIADIAMKQNNERVATAQENLNKAQKAYDDTNNTGFFLVTLFTSSKDEKVALEKAKKDLKNAQINK